MNRQRLIISEKLMRQSLLKTVLLIALNACVAAATARANGQRQGSASGTTFRALTHVVNVYAVVRDREGHLVRDLQRADFQLTEDSVLQSVRYFSQTTDAPLALGLAIDTTMCQDEALPIEKEAAKDFLREVLRPGDQAFVLHFGSGVEMLQGLTGDFASLARGIDEAAIEEHPGVVVPRRPQGRILRGPHHLYDAVYRATNELKKSEIGLRVLVLLTDGFEQGSQTTLAVIVDAAERTDVIVYGIDVLDPLRVALPTWPYPGRASLDRLAQQTGGRVFQVNPSYRTPEAFAAIAEELRTQYFLGYTPSKLALDGSFRNIRVRVPGKDYTVRARPGYRLSAE